MDGQKGLAFIINTRGGDASATESIIRAMQASFNNVTAIVPVLAASAGTLIALSCQRLFISETAILTSTDPIVYPRVQAKDVLIAHQGLESDRCVSPRSLIAGLYPEIKVYHDRARKAQAAFLLKAGRSEEQVERILAFFYDDLHKNHEDPVWHKDIQHLPLDVTLLEGLKGMNETVRRVMGSVSNFIYSNPDTARAFFSFMPS